ncbi:MAG: CrcB family protein [Aquisalimonadaceae bacterium]
MLRPISGIYCAVALGSALGAIMRYLCSVAMLALLGAGFAWGTLTVNILGSFLIGLYAALSEPDGLLRPGSVARQFVLSGFCGGFTTFSIFSLETLMLAEKGAFALAGLYIGASVGLWLIAVWAGYRVGTLAHGMKGG